jgi:hypothetical protein
MEVQHKEIVHICTEAGGWTGSNDLYIYLIKAKERLVREVPLESLRDGKAYLNNMCNDSVMVHNVLVITGGGNLEAGLYFKETWLVHVGISGASRTIVCTRSEDMFVPRACHSLVLHKGTDVFCVGGLQKLGVLPHVEYYSMSERKWALHQPLNKARMQVSLASFNGQYIYAFGGCNQVFTACSDIERLDTMNTTGWQLIITSNNPFPRVANAVALQVGPDSILIAGGETYLNTETIFVDSAWFFSPNKCTLVKTNRMLKPAAFRSTTPYTFAEEVYIVDRLLNIDVYNLKTGTWRTIFAHIWLPEHFPLKADTT